MIVPPAAGVCAHAIPAATEPAAARIPTSQSAAFRRIAHLLSGRTMPSTIGPTGRRIRLRTGDVNMVLTPLKAVHALRQEWSLPDRLASDVWSAARGRRRYPPALTARNAGWRGLLARSGRRCRWARHPDPSVCDRHAVTLEMVASADVADLALNGRGFLIDGRVGRIRRRIGIVVGGGIRRGCRRRRDVDDT